MDDNPVERDGQQWTIIYTFPDQPDIIDFHLKRYDYQTGTAVKTVAEVKFPMLLTLQQHGVPEGVQWKLRAVVSHLGETVGAGHYVATARVEVLGKETWQRLDDGQQPSFGELLSPSTNESLRNGLLLSYERVDPPGPPPCRAAVTTDLTTPANPPRTLEPRLAPGVPT